MKKFIFTAMLSLAAMLPLASLAQAANIKGLSFDGVDDVVSIPVSHGTPFTIEFWFRPENLSPQSILLYTADDGSSTWSNTFRITEDGAIQLYLWDGSQQNVTGPVLEAGKWYHVAGTGEDDVNMCLYVNGVACEPTEVGSIWSSGDKYLVGQQGSTFFQGAIDDLKIWSKVLTEQQIKDDMGKELTGKEGDLVGYWKFDDGKGDFVTDMTKAYDGLAEGGPVWGTWVR